MVGFVAAPVVSWSLLCDASGIPEYLIYPVVCPVFDTLDGDNKVVAVMAATFYWASYLKRLLPPNSPPLTVILENSSDGPFTYSVQGSNVDFVGRGNHHATSMSHSVRKTKFNISAEVRSNAGINYQLFKSECAISMMVYPTVEMYNFYNTNLPLWVTVIIVLIFVFTAVMFLVYDRLVERRQRIVLNTAVKSSQIVSSVFPKQIRDRLFADAGMDGTVHGTKTKLKSFLFGSEDHNATDGHCKGTKPIADLCELCFSRWFMFGCNPVSSGSRVVCAFAQFWKRPFFSPT